jgi:hypothetical protein
VGGGVVAGLEIGEYTGSRVEERHGVHLPIV